MSSNRHRHSRFKLLMLETNRPVVLTFLTFFLTLNLINSRRKEKGFMQLSHIQLHEKKVTELLDKELKELKSLQGRLAYIRSFPISQEDANRSPG